VAHTASLDETDSKIMSVRYISLCLPCTVSSYAFFLTVRITDSVQISYSHLQPSYMLLIVQLCLRRMNVVEKRYRAYEAECVQLRGGPKII